MCTLSVIRVSGAGVRVVMNRDESDARPAGEAPAWRDVGAGRVLCPRDPQGGGTWIACTRPGLVVALLNLNQGDAPRAARTRGTHSRGLVALHVAANLDAMGARRAGDAGDVLRAYLRDVDAVSPFRLVSIDREGNACEHAWDGAEFRMSEEVGAPVCWASSGLGDAHVQRRLPLFREFVARGQAPTEQDAFHAHAWDDAPQFSVLMRRPGYRTVSVTTVEVASAGNGAGEDAVRMWTVDVIPHDARAPQPGTPARG